MSVDILEPVKKARKPREASLWQAFKAGILKYQPSWAYTRVESRATLGFPDLLLMDHNGAFHLVEMKVAKKNKVEISPHQVAFASKHKRGSCWILVQRKEDNGREIFLYHASQAVDLRMDGLTTEPMVYTNQTGDWENILNTIAMPV